MGAGARPIISFAALAAFAAVLALAPGLAAGRPAAVAPAVAPGDARARYLELLARKAAAEREAKLFTAESELAAKRTAYAVLDLSDRSVEFRVRGFTFKTIRLNGLELGRGSHDLGVPEVPTGVFTLLLKEGRGVETESVQLKTLTPDEARRAGITDEDTETLGAEQGEVAEGATAKGTGGATGATGSGGAEDPDAPKKLVGVAGGAIPPDPPPSYHMGFEGNVSILVVAERKIDGDEARFAWAVALGKKIGRLIHRESGDPDVRITLRMPLADGQALFRQLLPGQRLIIVA